MPNDFLSDKDKKLFREAMRCVKPLGKKNKSESQVTPKSSLPSPRNESSNPSTSDFYLSNYYSESVSANSILSYCSHSIPNKRLRELKNGDIYYQAKLDLHGLKTDEARNLLCGFIVQQIQFNNRCILIVHGKGGRHGEEPILKNLVNHWLRQLPQVLAFHSAQPRDGGTGALYVLLKRQRNL